MIYMTSYSAIHRYSLQKLQEKHRKIRIITEGVDKSCDDQSMYTFIHYIFNIKHRLH